jgi:perosamine synthetase
MKYPVYQPYLAGNEKKYVNECLDSTWISSNGKFIKDFEENFADFIGAQHAAGVCNGTIALHLALLTLGIKEGDQVIVPTLTYIASVNAITYTGATPVFVDSIADTWQMDSADIKLKITPKTRAIMCVHLYGHPCDMSALKEITTEHDLFLIEDCAEAIGSKYNGQHVGTFGDVATFSFYGNKTITTGEGGMLVTNDETLHDRAVHFKGQGLAKHRQYWHDIIGYNYRMTNIAAAIGLAQLEQIESILKKKRQIADWYANHFMNSRVTFQPEADNVYHSYWMCSILVDKAEDRDPLRKHLTAHEIDTRPLFYPIHTMPMYDQNYERHKVAEDLGWKGLNLPSYPDLREDDVNFIAQTVLSFYK